MALISDEKEESTFDQLDKEIADGIEGKSQSIPIGLPKLGRYANVRKRILTLLMSTTGDGKSSMLDTWNLNMVENHMNSPSEYKLKPDIQLFSMERNKVLRIAKWICALAFRQEAVEIQLPKLMGWWDEKLTKEEHALIRSFKPYIDQILNDYVTIHDGAKTPNMIYSIMKSHFEKMGEYDDVKIKGKDEKIYIPKDNNIVVIPELDHGNMTKTTKELPSKKMAIDKLVTYYQGFRDLEGAAPIWISQVNRGISGVTRSKDQEHELVLEDVKESGDIGDACDIAISLFNPFKYKQSSKTGYVPEDFVDKRDGSNYFRSCQILKSSYGADSIRIAMAFNGFCGQFKEMEKRSSLNDQQYKDLIDEVLSKRYFLNEK